MENLDNLRHSAAHLLAAAVLELWPNTKHSIGPAIENGFYFDFDFENSISEDDLPRIEQKMREIVKKWKSFERLELSADEAKKHYAKNSYKLELIEQFASEGQTISFYKSGDYMDLCRGGHVSDPSKELKHFKLLSVAGAYWRGDEKNKMLTRIYGTIFPTAAELEEHLEQLAQAKERDHRKLGKELDLFVFSDLVGKGLPLWTARGAALRRELERFVVEEEIQRGYLHVYTPDLANLDLYRTSGHYPYYKESMYAPITIDDEEFMLRPMTCPHHFELYKSKPRSYRELPMRIAELAKLYRYEKSGELNGLIRVRSFCLADAHIVTPEDQAAAEVNAALDLIEHAAKIFGLEANKDYRYRLSLGDREDNKKYFKDDASWDKAEQLLREVLETRDVENFEAPGEAAFYGPKIDIQMRNVNGKEDTAFTVQYDFVMPKRFELKYTDADGQEVEPVVVHRSSIGAIERVIAFLIERYGGAFPLWLAPEQVRIVPITDDNMEYAEEVGKLLAAQKIRFEIDRDKDRMQNKIRKAQELKVPYMLIVGKNEAASKTVSVRLRSGEEFRGIALDKFITQASSDIAERKLELTKF